MRARTIGADTSGLAMTVNPAPATPRPPSRRGAGRGSPAAPPAPARPARPWPAGPARPDVIGVPGPRPLRVLQRQEPIPPVAGQGGGDLGRAADRDRGGGVR